MALAPEIATSTDPRPETDTPYVNAPGLQFFVFALFFIFGGITSLNDVIIPKLKELFTLNYFEAMLVQSAFFAAYFIVSLPGAALVRRVGYMRGATIGLLTMMGGCILFVPASLSYVRRLPVGALRAGERHHDRASRGQPADLRAWSAEDGA
jgi:FHS family L-fucose permease-like MFS transporter